jgi:Dyp-type peroxidase family
MNRKYIQLEQDDMQGLLVRSYGDLKEACFVMLRFEEVKKGQQWLLKLIPQIALASSKPSTIAVQIAFTNKGLSTFLSSDQLLEPFSREFAEGMVSPSRSRILGDLDTNDPTRWDWGRIDQEIHAVLMLYASDRNGLDELYIKKKEELPRYSVHEVIKLETSVLPEGKEHFGFRDGVSQTRIVGLEKDNIKKTEENDRTKDQHTVMPGEFILGYPNEYNKIPFSPKILQDGKPFDLGRNGSYLVFRQFEQDVKKFWNFMNLTVQTNPHFKDKDEVYLASKFFGRWPNGNPLTVISNSDQLALPAKDIDHFLYKEHDRHGFGCPIGSHIRKSNPRDGIDNDPEMSIQVSKRHKILRRGRTYGKPLAESMNPADMLSSDQEGQRGLYFLCLNANISRQFEFIQNTWINNSKFDNLYNDIDPIVGFSFLKKKYVPCELTIQNEPVRQTVKQIPQFVFVKGGAYFFVPGIKALEVISKNSN